MTERKKKVVSWFKKLGFWGFMFFLTKGVVLYILIPYLIAKGIIDKDFFKNLFSF